MAVNILYIVLGIFMIFHGLVHMLAPGVYWEKFTDVDGFPYKTTFFGGRLDLGDRGVRLFAAFWVVAMLGFVVAGFAVLFNSSWWPAAALGAALFSLVLCVFDWSWARFGALIDVGVVFVALFRMS